MAQVPVFIRLQGKCLLSSTSKFKCNENIHKSDQPKATYSITSWLVVQCQLIARYRVHRHNTPIQCR